MSTRERVLVATVALLGAGDTDVSTRAICEAAGVGAPTLYRQFGDKDGLLRAVIDRAFGAYLASKREQPVTADPVADLKAGWDSHIAFARANPHIYRLMHSTSVSAPPEAVDESFVLLQQVLERCAAAGRLRIAPTTATQMVMAATIGMGLSLVSRPDHYPDPAVADRLRDAVLDGVLTGPQADVAGSRRDVAATANTLSAQLAGEPSPGLTEAEAGLLHEWLVRVADNSAGDPSS